MQTKQQIDKKKENELLVPLDKEEQKAWFKMAGLKMPKEEYLRLVTLFGIAHLSKNCSWDAKNETIKEWWNKVLFKRSK